MNTPKTRTCDFCQKDYQYTRASSRFCSAACRTDASRSARGIEAKGSNVRYCLHCGQEFIAAGKAGKRLHCSDACKRARFYELHADDKAVRDHKRRGIA